MAFNDQEKQLIIWGKQNGKTPEQVSTAIAKLRAGIQPTPPPEAPANSVGTDVAIGAAKELGSTVKSLGDLAASSVPTAIAGPIAGSIPAIRDRIASVVKPIKDKIQGAFGLTEEKLATDNRAQDVGKDLMFAAEVASPFVVERLAGLVSKGASLASTAPTALAKTGVGSAVKTGLSKAAKFAKNPRLTLSEANANPQLETSAKRLFLEGTKRLEDPLTTYDKYVTQAKAAVTDIKAEPPIAQVGSDIGEAFKEVVAQRRAIGNTMSKEIKKVGTIKTNVLPAVDNFVSSLSEEGLQYDRVQKAITQVTGQTKMTGTDVALLQDYAEQLQKLGSKPSISELDAFLSRIPKELDVYKSSKGITGTTNGERIIKNSLNQLRDQFDPVKTGNAALKGYSDARAAYADLSKFIEEGASYLGKITQSGDFSKDASIAKSSVQSILNNGKKDWLSQLEKLTGYPALDDSVLALQAMKDAGDFRGASLLESLSQGAVPTSATGVTQKMIDYAISKAAQVAAGTPEEQTRVFLTALKEAATQTLK